jgi:hypothetical protein
MTGRFYADFYLTSLMCGDHKRGEMTTLLKTVLEVLLLFLPFVLLQNLCGSLERGDLVSVSVTKKLHGGKTNFEYVKIVSVMIS